MRQFLIFPCQGHNLAATLDCADGATGLLIVSGGNEIRAGAHGGQAALARRVRKQGFAAFRYDRRGIGESEGENGGFTSSSPDIAAAVAAFRAAAPQLRRVVAFGNCDAASALMLYGAQAGIDALILANPWTIEQASGGNSGHGAPPPPAAIRARYLARLKNPGALLRDLASGRIAIGKFLGGAWRAMQQPERSGLAMDMGRALAICPLPATILIARGDMTAQAFKAHWQGAVFTNARASGRAQLLECATASHSFSDQAAQTWLHTQILSVLARQS